MPAAVRTATDVRAIRSFAVGNVDQRFGQGCECPHRLVAVIQARLRIEAERGPVGGRVARVRAQYRETLRERMCQRSTAECARGGNHAAVDATVALVPEASVPIVRQAQLE